MHGQLTELATLALIPPKAPILGPGYIKETAGENDLPSGGKIGLEMKVRRILLLLVK